MSDATQLRRRAALAMTDTPAEIDGMRVLFDRRVTLFPVTLVERAAPPAGANGRGTRREGRADGGGGHGHVA